MFEVLLPVSRLGPKLQETLEAVAASEKCPVRVVLVLDGEKASDGDRRNWSSLPFEVVAVELPKSGITAALSAGEARLTNPFFARLDVGDVVAPSRFSRQLAMLVAHREHVAVGVRTRLVFPSRSSPRERLSSAPSDADIARELPLRNLFVHGSLMMRTEAVRRVGGYDRSFPTSQDYDLLLRLSQIGRLSIIPEVLHTHFFEESGSTLSRPRTQLMMSLRAKRRHWQRGYRPSGKFVLYFARDLVLLMLPSRVIVALKSRSGGNG